MNLRGGITIHWKIHQQICREHCFEGSYEFWKILLEHFVGRFCCGKEKNGLKPKMRIVWV